MRCLEKEPEARWPTADALRRALESRSAPAYRAAARRPSGISPLRAPPPAVRRRDAAREAGLGGGPWPVPGSPDVPRRCRRGARRELPTVPSSGEPDIVRTTRARFVTWVSIFSGLALVDVIQGGGLSWALFGVAVWGAFSVVPRFWRLWEAGYSWRDVFNRPAAPDAAQTRAGGGSARAAMLRPVTAEEFGRQVDAIQQARSDRQAILKIVEKLPASERQMLPDVVDTVDKLVARAENLARALHNMSAGVDAGAVPRLDEKIEALAAHPRIGERSPEQHGDDPAVLAELAELNRAYEERYGFRFVVFVNGRSRAEILPELRRRLESTREQELDTGLDALVSIAEDRWRRS